MKPFQSDICTHLHPGPALWALAALWALVLWLPPVSAAAQFEEKQLARELEKSIDVGEIQWLDTGQYKFLAVYLQAQTPKSRGGVILLHGLGAHADWPQMISPLRKGLPENGWNTLSLQLGILRQRGIARDYEYLYRDTGLRIKAAIAFLEAQGIYNIVLVGHSLGGSMALYHLGSSEINKEIIAFVGVAMYDPNNIGHSFSGAEAVAKLRIPMLDLYGRLDSVEVIEAASERHIAAKRAGKHLLTQVRIPGADHFFTGLETTLLKRIKAWINNQAPSMEIEKDKRLKK